MQRATQVESRKVSGRLTVCVAAMRARLFLRTCQQEGNKKPRGLDTSIALAVGR